MSTRRKSLSFHRRTKPGAPPGTLQAPANAVATKINLMAYSGQDCITRQDCSIDDINELYGQHQLLWIDIAGLGDVAVLEQVGAKFNLHPLSLEDVLNVHQRPKTEQFGDLTFVIARMADAHRNHVETEQLAIFFGKDFLITIQELPGDCLDPIRNRIKNDSGRIRTSGTDYLFYAVLDAVIDDYFPVLENLGEQLEDIEGEIVRRPRSEHIRKLHDLKRDLLVLRRAVWPHREMVNGLIRDEHVRFDERTKHYFRDIYDHTIQLMDIVETYREIASGLIDIYISSMSAKLNEIMKVLAIISTIFMPISFIAGFFGMNFNTESPWNMPELAWRFGYFYAIFLMLCSVCGMLYFFYRKGWIGLPRWAKRKR